MTARCGPASGGVASRPPMRRVWAGYAGAFGVIALIGVVGGENGQRIVAVLSGLLGVAGIWYGVRRHHPPRAGAWVLLACAVAVLAAAEVVLGFSLTFGGSYPSIADAVFVGVYLPLAV